MDSVALQHVCVLLDHQAPRDGALLHALDWASRLSVPLQILKLSSITSDQVNLGDQTWTWEKSATEWGEQGIRCETLRAMEQSSVASQLFRPGGLSVFSDALPAKIKNRLLRSSLYLRQNATLVCSGACCPVSRFLIVHAPSDGENGFLAAAVSLCQLFEVVPVVLTVADTETKARQSQRLAEEACRVHHIPAILDYAVGLDVRAVASIARWRRCSHVFLPRRQAIPWWRWKRGDTLKELLDLADSLTFLALPESGFGPRAGAATSQENSEHFVAPS